MKNARRCLWILLLTGFFVVHTPKEQEVKAVIPIAKIIKEGVKKVIKAVDLMIQRLQNKTIWLQNAQKVLENTLSQLKLKEIAEWTEKHRKLYEQYYDELWKVKNTLAAIQRIRDISNKQVQLVNEYKRAWNLLQHDTNFTPKEIDHMYRVYSGIIRESVQNLNQILLVLNSFKTQMTDGKRLDIIAAAGASIQQNYMDLLQFNAQNFQLSINRARTQHEITVLRKLYGI